MTLRIDRDRLEVSVAAIIRQHGGRGLDPDIAAVEISNLIEAHGITLAGKRNRREADRLGSVRSPGDDRAVMLSAQSVETAHQLCIAKGANRKKSQ